MINPLSNKIAFKMEDGTFVDCFRCYITNYKKK